MSFQVGRDAVFLVATEYHIRLHGTDGRRKLSESNQVIEEAGDLTGKVYRSKFDDRIGKYDGFLIEVIHQSGYTVGRDIHLVNLSEDVSLFGVGDTFQFHFSDEKHFVAVP